MPDIRAIREQARSCLYEIHNGTKERVAPYYQPSAHFALGFGGRGLFFARLLICRKCERVTVVRAMSPRK